ncbi:MULTISPECIES: RNA 3'-terminal phosphate cyclase [unclassified Tolypothrix]|uniref:RNA 3'-terminal phosphate cyclase n=1 Tax=unclassified Tolypothrix TaxID=2649714 RepID=UPI0005EABB8F|nr:MULTISPECIES: RNA 3'-terminal phosphate cyclase [unclassified Tolypothrix]BAY93135.1 RNA 3'-terminal phosphate cyclase [Microchaete diplosiphon NIES-3275]EKF00391.1 RNA 3'-terminal-phosphate cyclase [Tolypothrix sp. PCC 7601]MBE9081844.1 RNA 3'-terminal phosphate cyclase [Tolypothrix sp. LEGE 11397]UYD27011.1 RNA 3'-terminal phosphate cyclase [Tolypothrix sp. PCC 7712]UYD37131.1 RNA 3'-terminal phosphate cyclase [Tolypothrix sp. PCC 7601]
MIDIDGSYGEGGGQVLRTSLSLAAITGESIRIAGIRAKRRRPGLAAQHLTAVRAAARICDAKMHGDTLGSMMLEFIPGSSVKPGQYTFDVTDAQQGGSAGAMTLVLQTVLLPLALASAESQVILKGGTHVPFSPTMTYIEQVYLPMLRRMGVKATAKLRAWGWYPQGGGEMHIKVNGSGKINGITLLERGNLQQVRGLAVVTELASHISQRMANRAQNLLHQAGLNTAIQALREKGIAPGAGVFLTAEYKHSLTGFGGFGRLRLPAEKVADIACRQLLEFHHTGAPVDEHLGDQLLLPATLALEESQYGVSNISTHLTTNAAIIEKFGLARITVDEAKKIVAIAPHTKH